MKRSRFVYFLAGCIVVPLGLASRRFAAVLPEFIATYAGDTLWALMAFLTVAFIAPRWPSLRVAYAALGLSYLVEISQLYHAPWIDTLRHTTLGGLLLGYGFLWSDLVCYTVGVGLGLLLEELCL
jgi:hypothetical protein